jgi:DNA-binding transcriptional ArsR family regulator
MQKVETIVHPVRLRILLALAGEELATQEIAERMADVPVSSLYRHLRVLLDEEIITVADTRPVKGVQEKVYRVAQSTFLGPADMSGLSPEEHMQYFTNYVLTLLQGFQDYLDRAAADGQDIDMLADRVGYTEVAFWADDAQFDAFGRELNQALLPLLQQPQAPGRRRRKLATITYPLA